MVMVLLDHKYFSDWRVTMRESVNELCVLAMVYVFIGLSDFVQGVEARVFTGENLIRLVVLLFVFNLFHTAVFSFAMPLFEKALWHYRRRALIKASKQAFRKK